ncbi:MAG: hypothetical protein WC701_04245 [Kiritimatiellales bacterium]|jgi:hypothetical protein
MNSKLQRMILLLLCSAGTGFSQMFHGDVGVMDMCYPYCRHDLYGYPCEHDYTLRVIDYPAIKKPVTLEPVKKSPVDDPFRTRLDKRMTVIDSAGFVNTNTVPIEIAPGLAPRN